MKIITTVGTSIFENCKNENPTNKDFKDAYKEIKEQDLPYSKLVNIDKDDIGDLQNGINAWFKGNKNASAEIASILAIAGDETEVKVHLIATDTVLSVLAAELIQEWFKQNKSNITVDFTRPDDKLEKQEDSKYIIQNLSVSSNDKYQEGFMNLIEVVSELIDKSKKAKEEVILNITGGYKAIIPIMTLLGQIKNVPLKYIYEESNLNDKTELVEVGNLPISFDWELGELYLDDMSKEGLKKINYKPEILRLLRELSLIQKDKLKPTPLGQLFKQHLTGQLTTKKSLLGYLVELKAFEYFHKQECDVIRGKEFWWDKKNPSKYYSNAKYNQDTALEQKIDVDIFIENNTEETWYEVKSCSKRGLTKALKQVNTMLQFIKSTDYKGVKTIGVILYKLETTDILSYGNQINNIKRLFKDEEINYSIQYIDIPENNDGMFNAKHFFEREINLSLLEN